MTEVIVKPSVADHRIWKFPLTVTGEQDIQIPFNAIILDVQMQQGVPCLWAVCNIGNMEVTKRIFIFGTGHRIDFEKVGKYIGTFQMEEGMLVFHVFEER
jgi:hypothetical protein